VLGRLLDIVVERFRLSHHTDHHTLDAMRDAFAHLIGRSCVDLIETFESEIAGLDMNLETKSPRRLGREAGIYQVTRHIWFPPCS
jgi:hypothetical protein